MAPKIQSHQTRPVKDELQELHEIAKRQHGPNARSTRRLREALDAEIGPQKSPETAASIGRPWRGGHVAVK
jgi:hypothetical protein